MPDWSELGAASTSELQASVVGMNATLEARAPKYLIGSVILERWGNAVVAAVCHLGIAARKPFACWMPLISNPKKSFCALTTMPIFIHATELFVQHKL
mmetsp:Transcript_54193/g.113265  ORF Transcript_54193/g.113265 Transcript_54193/m.113265 type:complete len:98 (-) Transcript_54193:766-1059(-)